jgi:hypothetical protein
MSGRFRKSLRIARVETVRHYRRQREHSWRSFCELFLVVFAALVVIGRLPFRGGVLYPGPGAYQYAAALAAGERSTAVAAARGFAGVLFVLVALIVMLWTAKGRGWSERADGLLTTVPVRTVVVGDVGAKAIKALRFLSLAICGGAVAFAAGSGRPVAALGVAVGGVALVVTAVAAGYVGGLAGLVAFRRSAFVRRHRLLVGSPLVALYFGLFVGSRRAGEVLGALPIGWYADLALAPAGGGDPRLAGAALVGTPFALGGLWLVAVALARRAWIVDPPRETTSTGTTDAPAGGVGDRLLAATCERPTRAVARAVWRRVFREPQALLYVMLPIALLFSVGYQLARAIPDALPALVAIYGGGAVGAGATLNPLGNEGRGLLAALTTPGSAPHLVRGYLASAALPGGVAVTAATVAVAAMTTGSPLVLLGAGAFAGALTVCLVTTSIGIGTALPEFDAIRPSENAGLTAPHVYAVIVYSIAITAVSGPVLGGLYLAGAGGTGYPNGAVIAGGAAGTLAMAAVTAALAYRYAVGCLEGYLIAD